MRQRTLPASMCSIAENSCIQHATARAHFAFKCSLISFVQLQSRLEECSSRHQHQQRRAEAVAVGGAGSQAVDCLRRLASQS